MKIRRFQIKDLDGLLETLKSLSPIDYLSPERWREIATMVIDSPQQEVWVLIKQDRVVATGSLLVEQKFIHGGGRVAHIEDVAVHREYQGQKLGRAIIEFLVKRAGQVGCYKVILNCDEAHIGFYGACGFRRHEHEMRLDL
jgi:glucosamine-phosphate N-acetyltransferase